MPRNPSGTYTLPEAAFVPGTVISSTAVNSDFSDIANALTDSLSRSGDGGMQAQLPMDATGFAYTNDPDTGMVRTGTNAQALKCGGSNIVTVTTSGVSVTGDLSVSGDITQNGNAILPIGLGPLPWSRVAAPAGWVFVGKTYSRTTYAALWAVAQTEIGLGSTFYTNGDGSTTFGVGLDMPGCVPACNDFISGSPAGTLTQAVFGSDPSIIGNVGGDQTVTLLKANLPNTNFTVTDPGHNHPITSAKGGTSEFGLQAGGSLSVANPVTLSISSNTTGISVSSGGSDTPVAIVQPTIITNYIIYAGA